jgi:hypothetical protein
MVQALFHGLYLTIVARYLSGRPPSSPKVKG